MTFPHSRGTQSLLRFFGLTISVLGILEVVSAQAIDPVHLAGLKWRNIGPFRGGRVSAVAGVVSQPDVFYIGLPQGGVWKTTSAGQTWYPVFDAIKETSCIGSVQVAASDPNIVYAGTGEISGGGSGVGVYRSNDAGRNWQHIGLTESRQIPSLLVDPHNPDLVLAAAMGGTTNSQKGVYRSTDGGKKWTRTLFVNDRTGIQHITWAFDNPGVIYASAWTRFQVPGTMMDSSLASPSPEIYKSLDEGITWKKLKTIGLPRGGGRFTVAAAQGTQSQRVYVIGTFGLFRSDDGGSTWRQMAKDDSRIANGQGDYSSGVYVDPQNPDIVYTLATCVYRSLDGGKSFDGFKGAPGGDDLHQLWIDPHNGSHILLGGDQGATVSLDAGQTWGSWYNQATGQVYHVSTDNQFPYWVYATQQDSGCIGTSSRGNLGAITPMDWTPHPGNEGGYIIVDPLDPKISYAVGPVGGIIRVTNPSGQWVQVEPNMSPESKLRGWSGQMAFSPTNPHELLMSFQYLLSSTDRAVHWRKISPDLTLDPNPRTKDERDQAQFAAIMSFSASPIAAGVIWAGTSNGLIHVTKDHGKTWENVSIPRISGQSHANVSFVEASHTNPAEAYAVVGVVIANEFKPHLYRTKDLGSSWSEIGKDLLKGEEDARGLSVIRSDAKRPGLLFGMNGKSVYVSFNDGDNWQLLSLNLPTTALSDLVIHGDDLVLGTFGRGIWILDDYSPLREISPITASEPAHLFKPGLAYRLRRNVNDDTPFPPEIPHAENPPLGAVVYYSLATKPAENVKVEIVDAHGHVIRHFSSAPIEPYDDHAPPVATYWPENRKPIPSTIGLNRINWNIRYDTPLAFNHDVGDVMGAIPGDTPAAIEGPLAPPGVYTVKLIVDGKTYSQKLTVDNDPRSPATSRELELEHRFRLNILAGIQEAWDGYHQIASLRTSLASIVNSKPSDDIVKAAKEFDQKLVSVGGTVVRIRRFYGPPQPTNFVGLNGFLLTRLDSLDYGDVAPTEPMWETYGSDWSKIKIVSDQWRSLQAKELVAFNVALRKHGQKPIEVSGPKLVDPPAPNKRYLPKPDGVRPNVTLPPVPIGPG